MNSSLVARLGLGSALATAIVWAAVCPALQAQPPAPAPPKGSDAKSSPNPGAASAPAKPLDIPTAQVVRANLEQSYLAYPAGISGLDPLIFECLLVPHFFVNQESWPLAIVLTPKIVLRMFNEESTPVHSPSFMPRISVFAWFQPKIQPGKPTFYGSVTLSHHSNGQAGPFLDEDGSINHEDGSFSTNYFVFNVYATGFTGRFLGWSSLGFEWHPGFNQDAELKGRYGLMRLHLASTLVADLPLHGQVNLELSAILDDFQHSTSGSVSRALERFPFALSYSMTVPGIDLGLYVGYYGGHDYYNIYFDEYIHVIQLGISGGFAPTLLQSEPSDKQ